MTLAARLLALWPGWVLGVALQLQQATLWPVLAYAALLAAVAPAAEAAAAALSLQHATIQHPLA